MSEQHRPPAAAPSLQEPAEPSSLPPQNTSPATTELPSAGACAQSTDGTAAAAETETETETEAEPDVFTLATLSHAISADFRRAVLAATVACAGLGMNYAAGGVLDGASAPIEYFRAHSWLATATSGVGAALFLVFGWIAVRSATGEILKTVPDRIGDTRKNGLRWICLLVGYLLVIFGTLGALNVPIERLLLGGAVTGVILGIAAQQSLGNLFAGLVLLVVRPFSIGQDISLRSGPLGGVLNGEVVDMNLTYVRLNTAKGEILLPNSTILSATIGPPHIFDP